MFDIKSSLLSFFLLLFVLAGPVNPIEPVFKESGQNDLILLSVAYYEVGLTYQKLGKKKAARQYLQIAYQLNKEVEKYSSGQLKMPENRAEINWHDILESKQLELNHYKQKKNKKIIE